jgi:hypothetical protein
MLKDWERYDVSRFVDPGCVSPEDGHRSVPVPGGETRRDTIAADLEALAGGDDLTRAVFLFHAPPYRSALDRAALDGRTVDHAPVDVHVGSIAIRRFIHPGSRGSRCTGVQVTRLTGAGARLGRTHRFRHPRRPELARVRFDPDHPEAATREFIRRRRYTDLYGLRRI